MANDQGGYVEVDLGGNANTGFVVDQSLGTGFEMAQLGSIATGGSV